MKVYVIVGLVLFTAVVSFIGYNFDFKSDGVSIDQIAQINKSLKGTSDNFLLNMKKELRDNEAIRLKHFDKLKLDVDSFNLKKQEIINKLNEDKKLLDKDLTVLNKNQKSIYNKVKEIHKMIDNCKCCKKQQKKKRIVKKPIKKNKPKAKHIIDNSQDRVLSCYNKYLKYKKRCNNYKKVNPFVYRKRNSPQESEVVIEQVIIKKKCKDKFRYIQECSN